MRDPKLSRLIIELKPFRYYPIVLFKTVDCIEIFMISHYVFGIEFFIKIAEELFSLYNNEVCKLLWVKFTDWYIDV